MIITGVGIGHLVDKYHWPAAFHVMFACAAITLVLMVFTWNVGAHPHAETTEAGDAGDAVARPAVAGGK